MNFEYQAECIFGYLRKNSSVSLSKILDEFTHGEVGVLGYLAFEQNGVTSGELSEVINVTTARIASILNSLENKGFVKRNDDSLDKRKVLVYITDKGKDIAKRTKKDIMDKIKVIIEEIGYEDLKEYVRVTMKIKEILNKQ